MHTSSRARHLACAAFVLGSLAAPTATAADPLQLPADGLVVGGTQLVTAGGAVGVGTAAPAALLDVSGPTTGEVVDQQQTVASGSRGGVTNVWQSFTAGRDGALTRLEFRGGNSLGNWSATLKIYSGEGTGGQLLASQVIHKSGNTWHSITLDAPIPVRAGQRYTWQLLDSPVGISMSPSNPYPDGRGDWFAYGDYLFKTYLIPTRKVVATAEGRLGVGTAAPDRMLTVAGAARVIGAFEVNGATTTTGGATIGGALGVAGPVTVAGVKPVLIKRLENLGNDAVVNTGISAADYHCVAAGWSVAYDVQENGSSVNMVWTFVSDSTWWLRAQFGSHSDSHESPDVDILCFHSGISLFDGNRALNQPN